ncbi:MAG: undecaprenyl/decaprenyl-phosphate alpha-N-acetylglucosaminyl 1-phosphate transferase, partial [Candidatus Acidiferrales bacterium]
LITISRLRRGLLPFSSPGKDHTAHRLSNLGFGQRGAVLFLYGLGCLFGVLALLVTYLSSLQVYVLCGVLFLSGVAAIVFLERSPYERQPKVLELHPTGSD